MQNIPDASSNIGVAASSPPEIAQIEEELETRDPEREELHKQYVELDAKITTMTAEALKIELDYDKAEIADFVQQRWEDIVLKQDNDDAAAQKAVDEVQALLAKLAHGGKEDPEG